MSKRVPAEWEPQEAIWLQWPGRWEKVFEPAFAQMASIIPGYERLHILCHSKNVCNQARSAIEAVGFKVIRDPILGQASVRGTTFDTNYLNWLVGNGFVITVGFDNAETDAAAKRRIEGYFPGRDVYVVEMLESWYAGGGVHCHTNDQPAL